MVVHVQEDKGYVSVAADTPRGRRRFIVFFIYLLLGPPLGALVFYLGLIGYSFIESGFGNPSDGMSVAAVAEFVVAFFSFLWVIVFFSYFAGGLQAAGTGLILAVVSKDGGRFGYNLAFLAALVPSFLGAVLFAGDTPGFAVAMFVTGIVASLLLRLLFRERFRRG